jgi:hypothetical protein
MIDDATHRDKSGRRSPNISSDHGIKLQFTSGRARVERDRRDFLAPITPQIADAAHHPTRTPEPPQPQLGVLISVWNTEANAAALR